MTAPGTPVTGRVSDGVGLVRLNDPQRRNALSRDMSDALGAGLNLALACDVILASRSARFESRFMTIGMHPGGGHVWRLVQRVGRQAAAAMVMFAEAVGAEEAQRLGLVWSCHDDDLEPAAVEMVRRAAGRPPALMARVKLTLADASGDAAGGRASSVEMDAQRWSMSQPEFETSVRAMQQRIADSRSGRRPD